jgi:hypothetical protein
VGSIASQMPPAEARANEAYGHPNKAKDDNACPSAPSGPGHQLLHQKGTAVGSSRSSLRLAAFGFSHKVIRWVSQTTFYTA